MGENCERFVCGLGKFHMIHHSRLIGGRQVGSYEHNNKVRRFQYSPKTSNKIYLGRIKVDSDHALPESNTLSAGQEHPPPAHNYFGLAMAVMDRDRRLKSKSLKICTAIVYPRSILGSFLRSTSGRTAAMMVKWTTSSPQFFSCPLSSGTSVIPREEPTHETFLPPFRL